VKLWGLPVIEDNLRYLSATRLPTGADITLADLGYYVLKAYRIGELDDKAVYQFEGIDHSHGQLAIAREYVGNQIVLYPLSEDERKRWEGQREGAMITRQVHRVPRKKVNKLCEALHDLLGQWDGRDPETDGPIDLETNGACVRKAQAVLAEVE